jgi:hypothetical protein
MCQKLRWIFPIIALLSFVFALQPANATVLINEGFEGNSFNRTPEGYVHSGGSCISGGSVCKTGIAACSGCIGPNISEIQSSVKHSGTYALKSQFLGEANGECGAASFKIIPSYYSVSLPTTFYVRFYIYWDANYRFYSASKIFERSYNFYFTIRGVSSTSAFSNSADNTPYGAIGMYSSNQSAKTVCGSYSDDLALIAYKRQCDYGDGSSWIIDLTNPNHIGWWYFEVKLDLANNKFSVWAKRPKDTAVTKIYSDMPWTFNTSRDEIHWMWMNGCGTGKGGGITYVDDVAIGDSYIGPTSGAIPSSPYVIP